jgi:two-component system, cell cycle response regulator DivK
MTRIVYVEDNDDNIFMLQTRLELTADYEVLIAMNGQEGLALVAKERPDLVLMDLNLPDIDGWEITRRLKADPATADIPVIALTAHAMSGDREKALAAGCDEFDTKPIDFERLLHKMNDLLNSSA